MTYFSSTPCNKVQISSFNFTFNACTPAIDSPTVLYVTSITDVTSVRFWVLSLRSSNLPWSKTNVYKNNGNQSYNLRSNLTLKILFLVFKYFNIMFVLGAVNFSHLSLLNWQITFITIKYWSLQQLIRKRHCQNVSTSHVLPANIH